MPRIELLNEKSKLPPEQHAEFDAIVEVLHRVGGPFAVMLHSPGLAPKVMAAGAQVRLGSILESKERELTILAVAREKDGAYEWASHVGTARQGGLSEETIEVVRHAGDTSGLPEDDRDIIEYVRQLLRTNKVDQALFDSLRERKSVRWLVELTATIGQYQYITAINNAFDLQPAPDADQLPV